MKKTRISAIVDHSSMGLDIGTQMQIPRNTFIRLRKAFTKFIKYNNSSYLIKIDHISGDNVLGDAVYLLRYNNKDGSSNCIRYEFKQQGTKHFLNVGGNPTCLLSGANDLPVLITDSLFSSERSSYKYNEATVTFKYANRIMYLILDYILEDCGFKWEGEDKKRLVEGDISITSYQLAWYSGDLREERDALLNYLRLIYGGTDSTVDGGVRNLSVHLGLKTRLWDHSNNLTVEAYSGDSHRLFSLTWYAKDKHPDYKGPNGDLLSRLIRWDCTFNSRFFKNNSIEKVKQLESKYIELCEAHGYDSGFVRFMSDKVIKRIKLDSITSLSLEEFNKAVTSLEDISNPTARKIALHWLNYGKSFEKDTLAADFFNIQKQNYGKYKVRIEESGIDISIPRSYYEAAFFNRIFATMTIEERAAFVKQSHNKMPKVEELLERSVEESTKFKKLLCGTGDIVRIRKLIPKRIKVKDIWILQK